MNRSDHPMVDSRPASPASPADLGSPLHIGNDDRSMRQLRLHVADRPAHRVAASGAAGVTRIRASIRKISNARFRSLTAHVAAACHLRGVTPGPACALGMVTAGQATDWRLSTSIRSNDHAPPLCPVSAA